MSLAWPLADVLCCSLDGAVRADQSRKRGQLVLHGRGALLDVCHAVARPGCNAHKEVSSRPIFLLCPNVRAGKACKQHGMNAGALSRCCGVLPSRKRRCGSPFHARLLTLRSVLLCAFSSCRQAAADHLAVQKQQLQACILKQFVGRLRHCEHVTADSMINIRGMCRNLGWEYPGAPDMQQDAGEFFAFLHSCLGGQLIKTTRRTFTGALPDNSDRGHEENMALLPVPLCDSHPQRNDELNLTSLVDTFFFENVAAGLRRKVQGQQQEVYALNT